MNKRPPFLQAGDKIGIVAPARKFTPDELAFALRQFTSWGLVPVTGVHLFGADHQYSGTDAERAADLQTMLDDPEIKAIISARGGYGTLRIIDALDFTQFKKHPKWICGYSDITVLHSHINRQCGVETLHCTMPVSFEKDVVSLETLRKALFDEQRIFDKALFGEHRIFDIYAKNPLNRAGFAQGELVGGNLSLLYAMQGSASDIDTKGKILFLEDLDEYLYHLDRMMLSLKRAGKLAHLNGLVIGGMTEMKDNTVPFGRNAEQIIFDAVREYAYPVCFDAPAGHGKDNHALYLGRQAKLSVGDAVRLEFV